MTIFEKELVKNLAMNIERTERIERSGNELVKELNKKREEIKALKAVIDAKNNLNERLTAKISELETKLEGDYIVEEDGEEEKRTEC